MQVRTLPPDLCEFRDEVMEAYRSLNAVVLVRVQVPELDMSRSANGEAF
jgi:hypothetical protein